MPVLLLTFKIVGWWNNLGEPLKRIDLYLIKYVWIGAILITDDRVDFYAIEEKLNSVNNNIPIFTWKNNYYLADILQEMSGIS